MKTFAVLFCLCLPLPLVCQERPEAAPGLRVPGSSMPYALDTFAGEPELIAIHHSNVSVNNHAGANVAGSLAGSFFYKPKVTTEISGATAAVTLHTRRPVFYLHVMGEDEPDGDRNENLVGWRLARVKQENGKRTLEQFRITQLTGKSKRSDDLVETKDTPLANEWMSVTPEADLANGQYVLMPVFRTGTVFAASVYAFGIDPAAPEMEGAVKAGAGSGLAVR